jgi:putative ABC transport system permease protein
MLMVAAHAGWMRLKTLSYRNQLPVAIFSSLLVSTAITLGWVTQVVLDVHPWYHPYSFIPLAGMTIGNSLNASILALERFNNDCQQNVRVIEAKLCLGASVEQATHSAYIHAMITAFTPTLNTMAISGIVSIPGITTGQLLGGQSPLPAVFYQLVVMFMLVATVMISTTLLLRWARHQTLNDLGQWRTKP